MAKSKSKRVPLWEQPLPRTTTELREYYKRLAKYADERMRKIENSDIPHAKDYAYRVATKDIGRFRTGVKRVGGKYRWDVSTKGMSYQTLVGKINAIKKFMNSETSTERGIKAGYKRRVDKINEKFGTNYTGDQLAIFFRSTYWKKMIASGFSSSEIMEFVTVLKRNGIQTKDAFKDMVDRVLNKDEVIEFKDDEERDVFVEDRLNQMLQTEGAEDLAEIIERV